MRNHDSGGRDSVLEVRNGSRISAADGLGVCLLEGGQIGVGKYKGSGTDAAGELHRGRVRFIMIEKREVRRSRGTEKSFRHQWAFNRRAQDRAVGKIVYQHSRPTPQPSRGQCP